MQYCRTFLFLSVTHGFWERLRAPGPGVTQGGWAESLRREGYYLLVGPRGKLGTNSTSANRGPVLHWDGGYRRERPKSWSQKSGGRKRGCYRIPIAQFLQYEELSSTRQMKVRVN